MNRATSKTENQSTSDSAPSKQTSRNERDPVREGGPVGVEDKVEDKSTEDNAEDTSAIIRVVLVRELRGNLSVLVKIGKGKDPFLQEDFEYEKDWREDAEDLANVILSTALEVPKERKVKWDLKMVVGDGQRVLYALEFFPEVFQWTKLKVKWTSFKKFCS